MRTHARLAAEEVLLGQPIKAKVYLLQGLLSRAKCDGQLWSQSSRTGPRYQDNARHRKRMCTNKRASVKCEVIDVQVERLLSGLILPDDLDSRGTHDGAAGADELGRS